MTDRPEGEVEAAIAATWETLADAYAERAPDKPHNAHYDRPAVLSLLPDLTGARAIDIGCGPGLYAEALLARGAAEVIGFDASARMVAHARARLAGRPGVTLSRRRIEEGLPRPTDGRIWRSRRSASITSPTGTRSARRCGACCARAGRS